jgi:Mg-chelatase subunit ChlD
LILFLDPVIASDGCVYEKAAIQELMRTQGLSPMTHKPLSCELFPASEIECRVHAFMECCCEQLRNFAVKALQQGELLMASAACERLGVYLAILAAKAAPALQQSYQWLCAQLGQSSVLPAPAARLQQLLGQQVQQANDDVVYKTREAQKTAGSKSVVFTVDVSGSMRGPRIEKARENLLKIFDDYIEDADELAMITFDHATSVQFELQEVGSNRETLRHTAERACKVAGGTAFYDALINTVRVLESRGARSRNQQWIISLTDGVDQHSQNSIDQALRTIQASEGKPNLIIVGIQLANQVKPLMEKLATATDMSIFIDASGGLESLDDAFQQVAELICE